MAMHIHVRALNALECCSQPFDFVIEKSLHIQVLNVVGEGVRAVWSQEKILQMQIQYRKYYNLKNKGITKKKFSNN